MKDTNDYTRQDLANARPDTSDFYSNKSPNLTANITPKQLRTEPFVNVKDS